MITKYIAPHLLQKYEFHNYGHALEILHEAFPQEWEELQSCLSHLSITTQDIIKSGGNESPIPKKFDDLLYPLGWREIRITGDLLVNLYPRRAARRGLFTDVPEDQRTISGYIDGHNIDFIKNKVAFDLEWNSKDQTFDRDLLAMRTYYDCDIVSAGIIITRSAELNDVFRTIYDYDTRAHQWKPIFFFFLASTTWMGKLTYRLDSRRNGGCPILAIGMKKKCITDWEEGYIDEHNPGNR